MTLFNCPSCGARFGYVGTEPTPDEADQGWFTLDTFGQQVYAHEVGACLPHLEPAHRKPAAAVYALYDAFCKDVLALPRVAGRDESTYAAIGDTVCLVTAQAGHALELIVAAA